MSTRATSNNSSSVGLFPFLAVLLCTMGALLVLLVVLAQRAGQRVADAQHSIPRAEPVSQSDPSAREDLIRQLEEVRKYQLNLRQLKEQSEARLNDEQLRLSHLEEHTRRLEHELAQLSLASQQLEATEKNQSVDREQAEREAERLQKLIADTEKQLEELREQAVGNRSYAIVPYKGQNGTQRKPIYIECSAEGIVLQPEGIRFQQSDFAALSWPGNPLAASLRATREHLKAQAARAGEPEPLDPYPLILVRPDGITQYMVARRAITSWDSDYGYEFIDGDWKVEFPDLPDPQLAQVQHHAVMVARDRLARLAQAAPSRFRGIGSGGGRGGGTGYGSSSGQEFGRYGEQAPDEGMLAQAGDGNSVSGNGSTSGAQSKQAGKSVAPELASAEGEHQFGAMSGDPSRDAEGANSYANGPAGQPSDVGGDMAGPTSDSTASTTGSGQPGTSGSTAQQTVGQAGPGAEGPNSKSSNGNMSGQDDPEPTDPALADSGVGWTLQLKRKVDALSGGDQGNKQTKRRSVPIQRPIQVVVRKNQMALLPSRHSTKGTEATGVVISLDQPLDKVSSDFVAALKTRIDEWGLAGNGLYWRPVLELHVGPDAKQSAAKIIQLLSNSGIDVRLPETAHATQGESSDASR